MAKEKSTAPSGKAKVADYGVLVTPVITEKSASVGANGLTVVFKVDPRASKGDIRGAVERVFSVKVESVRTARFLGKVKRTAKSAGRRAGYKKAYVTLAEGSKIDLVEGL
jgi:large subunit ribosomal protein L23